MITTDFLVIGSGIAGLTYAVKLAEAFPDKQITVLTKASTESETNTKYAQGGIAVVNASSDTFASHIQDTLVAGDGLCNIETVTKVVTDGPKVVDEIISWGTNFDKQVDGEYMRGKEGGHSEFRILHFKDITGYEIERALLEKAYGMPNILFFNHFFVLDIITQHHLGYLITKATRETECYGVYALDMRKNEVVKLLSRTTFLATGGAGQVYRSTTNPTIATGDGIAMVYRAKGRVENMEFIQFHPTALFEVGVSPSFLITEAVRGDGGILRNVHGEAFMERYDERKDLAPRDIVARAIDNEMKITGTDHVFLDCTHMDPERYLAHFPNIYEKCMSKGINPLKDYIPVAPAAHYTCGGIKVDLHGQTSIDRLYACGECSSTGLHGANRLASNSLLEALVFANACYEHTKANYQAYTIKENIPDWNAKGTMAPKEMILITQSRKELQSIMSDYVGIVRNNVRLERAMKRIDLLHEETEDLYHQAVISPQLCELRNLITCAYVIIKGAQLRRESRGLNYNTDYPTHSDRIENIVL